MKLGDITFKELNEAIKERLNRVYDDDMRDFCGDWHINSILEIEKTLEMKVEDFDILKALREDIECILTNVELGSIHLTTRQIASLIRAGLVE